LRRRVRITECQGAVRTGFKPELDRTSLMKIEEWMSQTASTFFEQATGTCRPSRRQNQWTKSIVSGRIVRTTTHHRWQPSQAMADDKGTRMQTRPLTLDILTDALAHAVGLRRTQRLEPAGSAGDKVFPPTCEDGEYATEQRRIGGFEVPCVLQPHRSSANPTQSRSAV